MSSNNDALANRAGRRVAHRQSGEAPATSSGRPQLERNEGNSSGRSRDDLSLAYSLDDEKSRAETYISAASDEEEDEDGDDDEVGGDYFHPDYPTQTQDLHESIANFTGTTGSGSGGTGDTPAANTGGYVDEHSVISSFFQSPLEYIFGGNSEDDVSTLGGGFQESYNWDGDESTIATTPTLRQEFVEQQRHPTIYESSEDEFTTSHESDSRSVTPSTMSGTLPEGESVHDGRADVEMEESTSYGVVSVASESQRDSIKYDSGTYRPATSPAPSMESREESSVAESLFPEGSAYTDPHDSTEYPEDRRAAMDRQTSYQSSLTGGSRLSGPSVTDEDAAQSRATRSSYSSSDAGESSRRLPSVTGSGDSSRYPRRDSGQFSYGDVASVQSAKTARSAMWRRSMASNKDWKYTKYEKSMRRQSLGDARTVYSSATRLSTMPETPEVIRGDGKSPMLTRGMSGRAVMHVRMDHAGDGSIETLAYTRPLVEASPEEQSQYSYEQFQDEMTIAGNRDQLPWFDFYYVRFKILRRCYSKQCYRINALLFVTCALIATVAVSVTSVLRGSETASSTSQSAVAKKISLSDLTPPSKITSVSLPSVINNNLEDWFNQQGDYAAGRNDVPFYFHVPLSGALIASESWGKCLGFVIASDAGKDQVSEASLRTTQVFGSSFVNVDLSTTSGIDHAARMDLVPSSLPDAIVSPLFTDVVTKLYSRTHRTNFVLTLRHPIDRAVAMFNYLKRATTNPAYNPALASMTIEAYALSGFMENNYVVRMLTGKSSGSLSKDDVNFCKELLRRKAVVGLHERMGESLTHFERYLGWTPASSDALNCQNQVVSQGLSRESVTQLDPGSAAYALMKQQLVYDLQLYNYVRSVLVPYQMEVVSRQSQVPSGGGGSIIS